MHIKRHLILSNESLCNFTFCGREVRQGPHDQDFTIHVTCEATSRNLSEILFESRHAQVRKRARERLTQYEQEQYESVVWPLQWIAHVARL